MREEIQTGEYYHVYNRGGDQRDIFREEKDYVRFLESMREFNRVDPIGSMRDLRMSLVPRCPTPTSTNGIQSSKLSHSLVDEANVRSGGVGHQTALVDFVAYCLNKNHFHFIVQQIADGGISEFMKRLSGGYTSYFNLKYKRSGSLFQGKYKYIHVNSSGYLLQLSCYIHGNPEIHRFARIDNWPWSSYFDYIGRRNGTLCNKEMVLNEFESISEYIALTKELIKESWRRKELLKYYLDV